MRIIDIFILVPSRGRSHSTMVCDMTIDAVTMAVRHLILGHYGNIIRNFDLHGGILKIRADLKKQSVQCL